MRKKIYHIIIAECLIAQDGSRDLSDTFQNWYHKKKLGGQGQGLVGLGASASCPPKRSLPFYGLSELEGTVDPPGFWMI
jgi:hypothetical protein